MSEEAKVEVNQIKFPQSKEVQLCSWNECLSGHRWPITLALAKCGGCGGMVLATKMENCPRCNEPVKECGIRVDHLAPGGPIVKFCHHEPSPGEVCEMKLTREHWTQMEQAPAGQTPLSVKPAGEVTT